MPLSQRKTGIYNAGTLLLRGFLVSQCMSAARRSVGLVVLTSVLASSVPSAAQEASAPTASEAPAAPLSLTGNSTEAKAPPAVIERVRQLLDAALNDYAGSRFSDARMVVGKDDAGQDAILFCGHVNPRNRMGGLDGWTNFVVFPGTNQVGFGLKAMNTCHASLPYDAHDYSADIAYHT